MSPRKKKSPEQKKLEKNKKILFKALDDFCAWESVLVTYSGSGDDGGIDAVAVLDAQGNEIAVNKIILSYPEEKSVHNPTTGEWDTLSKDVPTSLDHALYEFTNDWINAAGHSGYGNNEGGGGEMKLTREGMLAELDHYWNVSSTEHEGKITL